MTYKFLMNLYLFTFYAQENIFFWESDSGAQAVYNITSNNNIIYE